MQSLSFDLHDTLCYNNTVFCTPFQAPVSPDSVGLKSLIDNVMIIEKYRLTEQKGGIPVSADCLVWLW